MIVNVGGVFKALTISVAVAREDRVLRIVFGSKRDEVTGDWRKLHNEELRDLYSLPNIVRVVKEKNEMGGACGAYGGGERCAQGSSGET